MLAVLIRLLWRNVYSSLFYVLKIRWLCSCWSVTSLYILLINPLSGTRLADISPHILGLLFTLLIWYPLMHTLNIFGDPAAACLEVCQLSKITQVRASPGGSVVKNSPQCRGCRFAPWVGTKIPTCCTATKSKDSSGDVNIRGS